MTIVRDLLKDKGRDIWPVKPDDTVLKALDLMAEKEIGALPVMDEGRLRGIVSERDFVRSIAASERCLIEARSANTWPGWSLRLHWNKPSKAA